MDLPDLNLWLALSFADHFHHQRARAYWYEEAADRLAFCRLTALGFLRLATNAHAMKGQPLYGAPLNPSPATRSTVTRESAKSAP